MVVEEGWRLRRQRAISNKLLSVRVKPRPGQYLRHLEVIKLILRRCQHLIAATVITIEILDALPQIGLGEKARPISSITSGAFDILELVDQVVIGAVALHRPADEVRPVQPTASLLALIRARLFFLP